jgi:hypothetical protein
MGDGPDAAIVLPENKPPIIRGKSILFEIFIVILSLSCYMIVKSSKVNIVYCHLPDNIAISIPIQTLTYISNIKLTLNKRGG